MTNNIVIAGRLTEDAELRYTNSGSAVCNFTLANNRNYKNIEKSTFIDVNIFGPYAEAMHKYLLKGTTLDVTGELVQESWDHEGRRYYKHKIIAKELDFRMSKKDTLAKRQQYIENSDETDEIPDQGQIYIDEKEEIYNG